jgi:hypothetical protein
MEIQASLVLAAILHTTEPKTEILVPVIMVITIIALRHVPPAIELVVHVMARDLVIV